MSDALAEAERLKYERMWSIDDYRRVSPAMFEVERAHAQFCLIGGASVIDYGCGTGRATKWFKDQGYVAFGIDHAANALETDVPFVCASLWDLPQDIEPSDFAFSCDVAEHIPPERVADYLATIRAHTLKAAYFRIATRPDKMGPKHLGQPLRLTVQPSVWWFEQLAQHFNRVEILSDDGRDVVFLAKV